MKKYMQSVADAISGLREPGGRIRLSDVRLSRLPYIFAYVFELLLYASRGHFNAIETSLFGVPGKTVVMAFHGLASLVAILIWSRRRSRLIGVISVALTAAGLIPFVFLNLGTPRLLFAVLAYIGLGGAVTVARCGYAFALNNSERILGILVLGVFSTLIKCTPDGLLPDVFAQRVLPLAMLVLMGFCLLCFKEEAFEIREDTTADDRRGLYWALAYFIVYFAIDGYLWELIYCSEAPLYGVRLIGMLAGVALLAVFFLLLRRNVWHLWNVFFGAAALAALLAVFGQRMNVEPAGMLALGFSLFGWETSIYFLSCALRRFSSLRDLKICTVIFILAAPVANLPDDLISQYAPAAVPGVALAVVLGTLVVMLALAPYSWKYLFSQEWLGDLSRSDMRRAVPDAPEAPSDAPVHDPFAPFALTPRQQDVARLLLAAKTRRQIAGELGVSESTVKTHVTELYKKLGINSRVELFRLFGAAPAVSEEPENGESHGTL